MIDTTTVNYAIDKLTQEWGKVAPDIANVSDKYVNFIVTKEIIGASMVCGFAVLFFLIAILFFILGAKSHDFEELGFGGGFICLILFGICTLFGTVEVYEAVLAYMNPEMFTIHQLIGK